MAWQAKCAIIFNYYTLFVQSNDESVSLSLKSTSSLAKCNNKEQNLSWSSFEVSGSNCFVKTSFNRQNKMRTSANECTYFNSICVIVVSMQTIALQNQYEHTKKKNARFIERKKKTKARLKINTKACHPLDEAMIWKKKKKNSHQIRYERCLCPCIQT